MTILPKKKAEQDSDSDSDHSNRSSPTQRTHGSASHPHAHPHTHTHSAHSSPRPSDEGSYHHHHSPTDGYYPRQYDHGSNSSGDLSPELPTLGKRPPYRPPSSTGTGASRSRGKKSSDASPYYSGYNSAEEYDGPRRPYSDPDLERRFEQALKKECGFIIRKMRPDGACLFRSVADQVYGDQEMHIVVRNQCMDYMLKNTDYYSQYVTEDFERYINRKRSDHCFGNNLEMQAIAEMYNRKIEVYQYSTEPINIFFGVYKTDNAPIRLSYHGGIHYNSVVDPWKATVGVGLGLAEHKPGTADKSLMVEALRDSENVHLEHSMLEDKMRSSDWEATCEAIEEAVARESYLSWLREQEKRVLASRQGSQSTSAACGSSFPSSQHPPLPPPMSTTSTMSSSPSPVSHTHSSTLPSATSAPTTSGTLLPTTTCLLNFRGSPLYTTAETKPGITPSPSSSSSSSRNVSPTHSRRASHRGTPSPTNLRGSGSHHSSVRNSPYISPHTSPRSSLRGSPRGSPRTSPSSPHSSAHSSPRNSLHGSPPQQLVLRARGAVGAYEGRSGSQSPVLSQCGSPPPTDTSSQRVVSPPSTSTTSPHHHPHHSSTAQQLLGATLVPSPPHSPSSHSPPAHSSLDFESGNVLSQLPYEYSSFLDLPPSAFGLAEWEDDRVLAAVLAASQQEYIDSLRQNARGAESL